MDAGSGHVIVGEGRGVGVGVGVGVGTGAGVDAGAGAGAEVGAVGDVAAADVSSAAFAPPPQAATEALSTPITMSRARRELREGSDDGASCLMATAREDDSTNDRGGWP